MISVGLTGGIGSGKSIIARIFNILDVPVYDSDERAKYLMNEHPELIKEIKELLGEESYQNKKLNKSYIANRIFSDISLRNSLNSLVHRIVFKDYDNFKNIHSGYPYVIQESAILYEEGYEKLHNLMIIVSSPEEIKVKRLIAKGMILEDIYKRIQSQWADEIKIKKADFVIVNNDKESVLNQVIAIHHKILAAYI